MFQCLGESCKNHCCGAYAGMDGKMQPLSGISFEKIILLPEDIERLQSIGRSDLINDDLPNGISTIQTAADGTCAALEKGRCTVYDSRPAICRAYPLYLDMFTGICALSECGASDSIDDLHEMEENVRSLLEIYSFWLKYYSREPDHPENPIQREE